MHIVCPHCRTSYVLNLADLGTTGRNVRCSRCKKIWLARAEDAMEEAAATIMAEVGQAMNESESNAADEWNSATEGDAQTPLVDSPSIAGDFPAQNGAEEDDWAEAARRESEPEDFEEGKPRSSWLRKLLPKRAPHFSFRVPFLTLPTACAAMGALVVALVIWRTDIVRILPQTAGFYRLVGLDINLRGLAFRDVSIGREMVDGKPVLVIEGAILAVAKKTVGVPRLRFSVRDSQGAEIYAWNAVLEQSTLEPGQRATFKSRLASPPPEGRQIDIRFFNRRDLAGGSA